MSLIKRSPISARQLAANRRNARKSTGPRTEQGKQNSRFNGLKHGLSAGPFRRVMTELQEDPEEFDRFHQGLRDSTGPANELESQLVEDLALLWWKKRRMERAQAGVQVREVERMTVARERERHEAERLVVNQSDEERDQVGLLRAPDSRGKFQMALGWLDWLIACLERNQGWREGEHPLKCLYGQKPTVRGGVILNVFWELCSEDTRRPEAKASGNGQAGVAGETDGPQDGADAAQRPAEASAETATPGPEASRAFALRAGLLNLLLEERKEVAEELRLFRREREEVSEAARDACLAPTDQRWTWILRMDNYLDRQIERKIRLLVMLQEKRRKREAEEAAPAPVPPAKMKIQSLKVVENAAAAYESEANKRPTPNAQPPNSNPRTPISVPSG